MYFLSLSHLKICFGTIMRGVWNAASSSFDTLKAYIFFIHHQSSGTSSSSYLSAVNDNPSSICFSYYQETYLALIGLSFLISISWAKARSSFQTFSGSHGQLHTLSKGKSRASRLSCLDIRWELSFPTSSSGHMFSHIIGVTSSLIKARVELSDLCALT